MSHLLDKIHSVTTIGPVRLEPLPDGRYMLHIEEDPAKIAARKASQLRFMKRLCQSMAPDAIESLSNEQRQDFMRFAASRTMTCDGESESSSKGEEPGSPSP